MGGIEVVYELRNDTKYFIGSVTEIPADGMDYTNNIPLLFDEKVDYAQMCANTFNKYNIKSGSSRTCTISLVDCSQLYSIASLCKAIYSSANGTNDYKSLQRYKQSSPYLFFDFKQYVNWYSSTDNVTLLDELKSQFNSQFNKLVLYHATTPYIFNSLQIDSRNYSGLSTYIMGTTQSEGVNETYYKTLSWYQDVIK